MKEKKLKIAIFHLAFFYSGGGEKLVLEEIKELRKRGHKVDCFTPTINLNLCYPDIIKNFGIKTIFPWMSRVFFKHESVEIIATCLLFPFIAHKFKDYDVIYGANQPGAWFAWILKVIYKKPYVIYLAQPTRIVYPRRVDSEIGIWFRKKSYLISFLSTYGGFIILLLDKASIRGAKTMLVNGSYISGKLSKIYNRDYEVCSAGAHPVKKIVKNRWEGSFKINNLEIIKPYILLTNRHFPQKKFEYAILALKKIKSVYPDISLVITGNPTSYTLRLRRMVNNYALAKNVIFTGFVSERGLGPLYRNACLYIYTAPEEDFGMGVIEAMGAGIPVVAWNRAGPSTTIVNGETGFLIEPYSQEEFTKKILWLISHKDKNIIMGKNAKEHVRVNFSYKRHNDILEKALLKVAK